MESRFDLTKIVPEAYRTMLGLERYVHQCGLEESLVELIKLRCSQMNGCAYCIDMHWKNLSALGEKEEKLYSLNAWSETPFYSERERAALLWAEALTHVATTHAPDELYKAVREYFSQKELADLTVAIATINAWNRLAIAARTPAGTYKPAEPDLRKPA